MKKILLTILILITLIGCKKTACDINILTDDLLLYDVVDEFNASSINKVKINYLATNEETIFDKYCELKPDNIDMIVGSYNVINDFDFKLLQKIPKNVEDLSADLYINRAYKSSFGYMLPYSLDFNVLITLKNTQVDNEENVITEKNLVDLMNANLNKNRLIYSPSLSSVAELEYLLMFGCKIMQTEENFIFDTEYNNNVYNKYITFDTNYNISEENRDKIIENSVNIDRKYYLKQKIILFDIVPISRALTLDPDKYSIYYFKDTFCTTFSRKAVAMTKSDINEELSMKFIDFILSKRTQDELWAKTINHNFNNLAVNIPIYLDATADASSDYNQNIINITKTISDPDFINENVYKKFLSAYKFTRTLINNGQIDKKDFLKNITKNIN